MHDGLEKAYRYVNDRALGRYALRQAETTWNMAASMTPSTAQAYLQKADALGCRSLEILENRFPVVRQPTDQLVNSVKQSPAQVRERLLSTVESLVDHWLPPSNGKQEEEKAKAPKERLYELSRRVYQKADLVKLAETRQVLQEKAAGIACLNDALHSLVEYSHRQLKGSYESTQAAANQRMLDLTTELIARLDALYAYGKSTRLPDAIQTRLEPVFAFVGQEYDIIRTEALKPDLAPLQKASNIVTLTRAHVLPLLRKSIDGIQEQLRYYTVYANVSKDKFMMEIRDQLHALGISA